MKLDRARRWLLGSDEPLLWQPFLWLIYLGYLLLPLIFAPARSHLGWLWLTLLSIPLFLVLYFRVVRLLRKFREEGPANRERRVLMGILPIALLGYGLTIVNPAAFTYLTYVASFTPFAFRRLTQALAFTIGMLVVLAVEIFWLGQPPLDLAVAILICIVVCLATATGAERWRKDAALRLSHEEIRRLAALTERERIGRDLHDLLGHTLSLIALKSELAQRLLERDPEGAAREIGEVSSVAREALRQVRTAVTGIRSAGLATELVSARALLESSGVSLDFECEEAHLPVEIETALALVVREATTNIQRHAEARRASIHIELARTPGKEADAVTLRIEDDGRGGAVVRGNGLAGISERVRSLGGVLGIDSPRGRGTRLLARLPLPRPTAGAEAATGAPLREPA